MEIDRPSCGPLHGHFATNPWRKDTRHRNAPFLSEHCKIGYA